MTLKPLAGAVLIGLLGTLLIPGPGTAVQRVVLVEETGWTS